MMKGITGAFCVLVISCSAPAQADNFLEPGVARISSQEVQLQLHTQLQTMLGQGEAADMARLDNLESLLKPLYLAMPKGADGGLEHGTARYALHRFFAQQHGWHVRGLEATGAERWSDANSSTSMLEDHIPSYVLQLFEKHQGGRTGLRELAVLAATLEDVVHSEAMSLLSSAYAAQSRSTEEELDGEVEHRIVTTYLLFHTMPDPLYADLSTKGLNHVLDQAPTFWASWPDTVMWMQDFRDAMEYSESSRRNPFADEVARPRKFSELVRWIEGVGENYGQFQNLECRGMKDALLDLSDGSGRVRLAKFYAAAFENRSSHFSESPDYLRHLGALDETDPRQPSVVLTNYIYAQANCVASSGLYSICCIDECKALMAQLEKSIANPVAAPQQVADLVAALPSDTVTAPRNISEPMRRRLDDIAGRHGGSIPLHGRLFAQWMHHAFPNECSYPHMSGTLGDPIDPLAWYLAENETGLSYKVSTEEMQSIVNAALSFNASDPLAAAQAPPLPWTEEEELMVGATKSNSWLRFATLGLAVSSAVVGLIRLLGIASASAFKAKGKKGSLLPNVWV